MQKPTITHARLKEILDYDAETGDFRWKSAPRIGISAGALAGWITEYGYRRISIEKRDYLAHRVAWLYVTGEWPKEEIDHIDGNRLNNRFENLRDVPGRVNMQNCRQKTTRLLGAYRNPAKPSRWFSLISVNNRTVYLGSFDSAAEAHSAYLKAKRTLHAEGCTI